MREKGKEGEVSKGRHGAGEMSKDVKQPAILFSCFVLYCFLPCWRQSPLQHPSPFVVLLACPYYSTHGAVVNRQE